MLPDWSAKHMQRQPPALVLDPHPDGPKLGKDPVQARSRRWTGPQGGWPEVPSRLDGTAPAASRDLLGFGRLAREVGGCVGPDREPTAAQDKGRTHRRCGSGRGLPGSDMLGGLVGSTPAKPDNSAQRPRYWSDPGIAGGPFMTGASAWSAPIGAAPRVRTSLPVSGLPLSPMTVCVSPVAQHPSVPDRTGAAVRHQASPDHQVRPSVATVQVPPDFSRVSGSASGLCLA